MRILKKILLFSLTVALLTTSVAASGNSAVQPRHTYINTVSASLTVNETTGTATCVATASAFTTPYVKVLCYLQRYQNGGWQTVKTWSNIDSITAVVDETWHVEYGYTYRVRVVGQALDSSYTILESVVQFSKTHDYS